MMMRDDDKAGNNTGVWEWKSNQTLLKLIAHQWSIHSDLIRKAGEIKLDVFCRFLPDFFMATIYM